MNFLLLFPVILSLLFLGAHFFRADLLPLIAIPFILLGILFIKRLWVARIVQIVLLLGVLEWVRTLLIYVEARQAVGEPWMRLVIILGSVALFTLLSALVFQTRSIKKLYKLH